MKRNTIDGRLFIWARVARKAESALKDLGRIKMDVKIRRNVHTS